MSHRASRVSRTVLLGALALVASGCLPVPVTEQGRDVASLYDLFMIAAAGVFVIVIGLLAWTILRYRGAPGRDAQLPAQTSAKLIFEVVWWTVPTLLVAVLAVLTIGVLNQVDARAEEPDLVVDVAGYQWGWEFTYRDSGVVVNGTAADPATIELPVDRTVAFMISSRDVVHSFSIPNFLIKRDAIPSRDNRFDVLIEDEGTYSGQCGEFCGLLHSRQVFEIRAVSPDRFDRWLADQEAATP
ncbi:MAG: cytochrome c oxidase subunit II [Chloroflexi bacterium]|nr:cytochrome c oxidase subunit II [Chloroflexota bacterium]